MLAYRAALMWLLLFAGGFTVAGIFFVRRKSGGIENFVSARGSQNALSTAATLLASAMGAWILFAPAESATWGGIGAVTGYAIGSAGPYLIMIFIGARMRRLIPSGHTLTEFALVRYGRPVYAVILAIMLLYLFISLIAEITAIAKLVALIAPVQIWVTCGIVLGCTILYTAWGGLEASIFTDKIQMAIIIPLMLLLVYLGWGAVGGAGSTVRELRASAPELISLTNASGIKAGLTFLVAISLTDIFHQGYWQRIYAASTDRAMKRGFLWCGILIVPVIFVMGLFGLAFVAQPDLGGDESTALFSIVLRNAPGWFVVALIPLGLSLVMSSADTAISAMSSIIAVDARRLLPRISTATLMRIARSAIFVIAIPVWFVAAKGYSVLYLFLLADLFCAAAAFPLFFGLYSRRYSGRAALSSVLAGIAAGLLVFPSPSGDMGHLLEAFLLAAAVPLLVSWVMMRFSKSPPFNLDRMTDSIKELDAQP